LAAADRGDPVVNGLQKRFDRREHECALFEWPVVDCCFKHGDTSCACTSVVTFAELRPALMIRTSAIFSRAPRTTAQFISALTLF